MRWFRALVAMLVSVLLLAAAFIGPVPVASAGPSIGSLAGAGERPGATRLSFAAGDSVQAQVDVGSGNLLVSVRGLSLPDVNRQVQVGGFYNSAAVSQSPVPRLGRGWGLDYTPDVRVVQNADNSVTYRASGGLTGVFDLVTGSTTTYVTPGGFKSTLVKTASGWTLTEHQSQDALRFNTAGDLVSVTDRNGNVTSVATSGTSAFKNVTVTTPASTTEARTARVSTNTSGTTTVIHGASINLRQFSFAKTSDNATGFTDARGRTTTFAYAASSGTTAGLLTQIAAPGGVTTTFGYDAQQRVISISQTETATGGPGTSVTRLAYPSATQTLLADPNTNQSSAVSAVPHATYTLDATQRVTQVIDAAGRQRAATYTANFDTATATAGTGAAASTTTNTFGANAGESPTKTTSGTGSSQSLSYANASGPAQYNPTGGSDDAGNASTYTYNGAGNQLTSTNANQAQAALTYNTDGTVATAASPGNGTNTTGYGYTNKQPTSMTPVTGSSLGSRAYTYDTMGRLRTATNGRGITATYSYNNNDQVTSVAYTGDSQGNLQVDYTYNTAGRLSTRIDATGTTTWTYDQLGRLKTRQNTAGGGTLTYSYDKASRMVSSTSQVGETINYEYDAAGTPTAIEYPRPQAGSPAKLRFTVDDQGRRTGSYLQADAQLSVWAARTLNTYDQSGRVSRVTANTGAGTANVVDTTYCYTAGTTPAGGCTTSSTSDRDKLVWKNDAISGKATIYTYDTSGRLTQAAVTGPSSNTTYAYGFDAKNNRTSAAPAAGGGTQSLSFNAANQITNSGYTYDAAGNLTAELATATSGIQYTPANQLKSVLKGGVTYPYKHAGTDNTELVEQTSPDGTYQYTYGRSAATGVPIVEQIRRDYVDNGTPTTTNASIVSDPVTGTPLLLRTNTGIQSMYVFDGTPGAPIALLTAASQVGVATEFDPYGVPVVTQQNGGNVVFQNPYTFGGTGVRDRTTDWVHYAARYYSTKTGTFTQQDQLDAPLDPANANRYAYAGGDPINNTDPTGNYGVLDAIGDASSCSAGAGLAAASGQVTNGIALGGIIGGPVGGAVGGIAAGVAGCAVGVGIGRAFGGALDVVTGS